MARSITFNIITTAQTAQLKNLSNTLKSLKRDLDAINKASAAKNNGLNQMAKDARSAASAMDQMSKKAGDFSKNLATAGVNARTAGSAMNAAAKGVTAFGTASASAATGAKQLASSHGTLATNVTKSGAAMQGASGHTTAYASALHGLVSVAASGQGALTAIASIMKGLGAGGSGGAGGITRLASSFNGLRAVSSIFSNITSGLRSFNNMIASLASALGSRLRTAIQSVANVARSFANSVGSMFSGLQRAVQGIGNQFSNFGNRVADSMERARSSMMEFYAAGYSLLTIGGRIQEMGEQIFAGMNQSIQGFMEYERMRNRAAIAGATATTDAQGNTSYTVDKGAVDDLIFQMQRGQNAPPWFQDVSGGKALPVTFDSTELAQGLYYYSSAIGQPLRDDPNTSQNELENIGDVVQTIMQTANVTGTGLETMTKGVLNAAMEFGIDARDLSDEGAKNIANLSAQMGLLANMSTMEVPDIVESFKMMGPFLHMLSGTKGGAGIEESMMAIFAASEVGLRGGNIGRGLSQAFQSLLDPTDKMIESAKQYFPEITDKATFKDAFFETVTTKDGGSETVLRGGLQGFFEKLGSVTSDPGAQAQLLAELFTSNATRGLVGVVGGIEGTIGGLTPDDLLKKLKSDDPFEWLAQAAATTANSVSGWFAFMQNAWFQFQAAITNSVSGPLMNAFRLIGEVLFEIAERMKLNPRIGQTIAAIVAAIASLATVIGSVMLFAGGMLLLGRAFALLGGTVVPFIHIIAMAGATFFALLPVIALLAAGIGLLVIAFKNNFLGMKSGVTAVANAFKDFDGVILPIIERVMNGLEILGRAFGQFVSGILAGSGNTRILEAALTSAFGPILGGSLMNALNRLRSALDPVRKSLQDTFSDKTINRQVLSDATRMVQGFFEQVLTGQMQLQNAAAMNRLGDWLGIDNLSVKVAGAASVFRNFVIEVMGYARLIGSAWSELAGQIHANLARALGSDLGSIFSTLGQLASGIAAGMVAAFTLILGAVEKVTGKLADMAQGLRTAGSAGTQVLGFTIKFNTALQLIGATIGLVLGAKLALAFGPFMGVATRIIPILSNIAGAVIGLAGKFVVLAANIAISVAEWVAELAVGAAVLAIKLAVGAANLFLTGTTVAQTGATTVLTAAYAALSGVLAANGGIVGVLSLAFLALTPAELAAAAAAAILTAGMGLIAIVAAVVAVAMFGVVIALTAFAAAAILITTYNNGLIAGFHALVDVVQGAWAGMQFGISILSGVVSAIMTLVGWMGKLVGVGNDFRMLGILIGVSIGIILVAIAALIAALSVLAAVILIPFLIIMSPVIAIGVLIYQLIKNFDNLIDAAIRTGHSIKEAFTTATDGVELVFTQMIDGITGAFADGINKIIETTNKIDSLFNLVGWNPINMDAVSGTNLSGGVESRIADRREKDRQMASIGKQMEEANAMYAKGAASNAEAYSSGLMRALGEVGLDDDFAQIMNQLKIDPDNLNFSDIQKSMEQLFKAPENLSKANAVDWKSILGPSGGEYAKALNAWEQYNKEIDRMVDAGVKRSDAIAAVNRAYMENGIAIPKEPVLTDYLQGEADGATAAAEDIQTAAEKIGLSVDDITKAFQGLSGMSTGDFFSAVYGPLAGKGGESVATYLAGAGGDAIVKAIGDKAPWMNQMELIADAAGTGLNLATGVFGKNLHTVLGPYLQIVSQQTGIAVNDLLADVPKFAVDEKLMGVAGAELGIAISKNVPAAMYPKLDTLGQDIFDALGNPMEQYGLDWAELQAYAVGQAVAGVDWNLADYISESWGISIDAANKYLADHGIDPNVISSSMFEATKAAALTSDGAFSAMSEEMYNYLAEATGNFTTKTISMTEAEWAKIPDAYKAVMKNLGITTIIRDMLPQEAFDAVQEKTKALSDAIAAGAVIAEGATAGFDTVKGHFSEVARAIDESTGVMMVTLQDLDGTQVSIPAVEYDAYLKSLADMEKATADWRRRYSEYFETSPIKAPIWDANGNLTGTVGTTPYDRAQGMGQGSIYQSGADFGPMPTANVPDTSALGKALGIPEGGIPVKVTLDAASLTTVQADVQKAVGGDAGQPVKIKVEVDKAAFSGSVAEVVSALGNISSSAKFKIKLEVDQAAFASSLQALIASLGSLSNSANFKIKITPDIAYFAEVLNGLRGGYESGSGIKLKIAADLTEFTKAWGQVFDSAGTNTGVTVKIKGDLTEFQQAWGQMFTSTGSNTGVTVKVKADLSEFQASWGQIFTSTGSNTGVTVAIKADLTQFQQAWGQIFTSTGSNTGVTVAIKGDLTEFIAAWSQVFSNTAGNTGITVKINGDNADALVKISDVQTLLNNLVAVYTAGIAITGYPEAVSMIGDVQTLLNNMVAVYTAGVAISGYPAAVSMLGDLLRMLGAVSITWTAVVNVVVNRGSLDSVVATLNGLDGRVVNSVANVTTNNITTNTTINRGAVNQVRGGRLGSAGIESRRSINNLVARATGGMIGANEYTLVGEQGPELVQLPVGSFVNTANQTERMLSQRLSDASTINPFLGNGGAMGDVTVNKTENSGDTFIFNGDINIGDQKSADDFFAEIDRRSGRRAQLARRGMVPNDERYTW